MTRMEGTIPNDKRPRGWLQTKMLAALAPVLGALTAVLALMGVARADTDFLDAFTVDLDEYAGLWYELARTPNDFEDNLVQRDGTEFGPCGGSTATYGSLPLGRISILNECTRTATNGSGATIRDSIEGAALITPDGTNRKLKIAFGPPLVRFIVRLFTGGGADYWIYALGPVNGDGVYDWAVVSGPDKDFIFVLTRTPNVSDATLGAIIEAAEAEGLPTEDLVFGQP